MIQTRQRIDYRSGKVATIRRTSMSYDRLMQVVAEQAMQRAMVQINRRTSPPGPSDTQHQSLFGAGVVLSKPYAYAGEAAEAGGEQVHLVRDAGGPAI